jgi:hypothetical protein
LASVSGQREDKVSRRELAARLELPDRLNAGQTVHDGHLEVHEDDVELRSLVRLGLDGTEGFETVRGDLGKEARFG